MQKKEPNLSQNKVEFCHLRDRRSALAFLNCIGCLSCIDLDRCLPYTWSRNLVDFRSSVSSDTELFQMWWCVQVGPHLHGGTSVQWMGPTAFASASVSSASMPGHWLPWWVSDVVLKMRTGGCVVVVFCFFLAGSWRLQTWMSKNTQWSFGHTRSIQHLWPRCWTPVPPTLGHSIVMCWYLFLHMQWPCTDS